MKIGTKIIISLLIIGTVPILAMTLIAIMQSGDSITNLQFEKLTGIRDIKKAQIESYFHERQVDLEVYSVNADIINAMNEFTDAFEEGGLNGDSWKSVEKKYGKNIEYFNNDYGYYDVFLISPKGDIVYTATKEPDIGQNLVTGDLANSGLGKAFKKGQSGFAFADFSWYDISNEPASFIAKPIKDNNGSNIGVLAFQLSLTSINSIMQQRSGMGETGETYLIGSDKRMRSNSFLDPEGHSVKASFHGTVEKNGVDTEAATEGIAGNTETRIIIDYNGNPVLSSFTPIDVLGEKWVLIAEIDEAEVDIPANDLRNLLLIIFVVILAVVIIISLYLSKTINASIKAVVAQIEDLVKKIVNGKLDARGDVDEVSIDFKPVMTNVNELTDAFVAPINVTAEYVDRISKGDIPPRITDDYKGDFNEIKNNLNQCIDVMNGLVKETDDLIVSVSNGKLDMRGNPDKFTGGWAKLLIGVNELCDAFVGPINVTAEYVDRISKGDMPPKITEEYKGDFNEIKNNLNQCISAIELMISDSKNIAHNVSIGKLRFRADGERHQGDYRDIIMGTNSALDGIVGLLDSMPLPVMGIDNEFNILYMNELGASLDGKRSEELDGIKCFNHFKTSDCNTDNCACNQAMKLNQMASSETDAHPGQHDLEIKYTGVPIKDNDGKVIGAFEVVVDQTEVVQAMAKGKEISEYQKNEADKLTDCLVKMADGNFDFKLEAAEGNEVTKDAAEVFNTIADSVNTCVDVIKGLQNETIGLIDATKNGKLDTRGDSAQFNGDWGALLQGVNELCDAFVGPINVTAEYVDRISKGDIPPRIVDDYNGDFNEIKNNLNQCIDVMSGLLQETDMLIESVSNGKLDMRGNPDNFMGDWATLLRGVNNLCDAFVGPINVTAEYVDRISKGDIPPKITDDYKGDFNEIKNNLNQCIDAVNALVEDSFNLANSASIGKLRTRADESAHGGSFGQIVGGVNRALDSIVGLLDNLPIPVMGIDNEFNILYMNETGASIDGKTGKSLEDTKCYNYFKTSHCKTEDCACHLAMSRNDQATAETDAHPAGLDLDIKYTGRPIHDENGNVIGAFEVVLDLTDVKQAMRQAEKEQQMVQIQMEKAKRVSDYQQIETDKIVNTVETLANGDFSADVMLSDPDEETQEAYDTLSKILDAVKKFTDAVLTMGEDATILADAAKSGVLETRADTTKHQGDFGKIISGINEILDNILKPVNEASSVLEIMATGDLTTRMRGEYEGDHQKLKDSINSLGSNLGGLITQVSELAGTVTEIAVEISSNSETMASGSQEQSAQADEVATAVEEMSRTVTENAMGASKTAEEADRNGQIAQEGGSVVEQTVGKMRDIANVVKLSAENMEKLGNSSQQIGEIISVIDDIADQTNLLALNAAIEAARAGEQGRGFAVVADEVRKLAERTTEATQQIADMIKGIQNETSQAVTAMNQGNEEVNSGIELADKAGNSLQEIVSSSQEVLDMINQIAAASEEQSSTSEQIARNVEAISHVTNDSAKKISEIAHSSDELRRLTNQLSDSVGQFKVKDDGSEGYDSYQQDLKPRESHLLAGNGAR